MRKTIPLPSQEALRAILDYSSEDGVLIWKARTDRSPQWNGKLAGKIAGGPSHKQGYWVMNITGIGPILVHRVIWKWLYGFEPPSIDHVDGNRGNNRAENLRAASHLQNMRNTSPRAGKSLPKGVSRGKANNYRASIYIDRKNVSLGVHETPEAAHEAYRAAAAKAFGEFACFSR